jgi:hypothetical protein
MRATHITAAGVWLGALTAASRIPDPTRLLVVLVPAAGVTLTTGVILAEDVGYRRWVQIKTIIGLTVAGTGFVVVHIHLGGPPAMWARGAGAGALMVATVVAVIKPGRRPRSHPHRKDPHAHQARQVVPRTETRQGPDRAHHRQKGGPMNPRREPALILGLVAAVIQMVSAFVFPLTVEQQGVLNAVAVAVVGLITAIIVRAEQLAPAILGLVQSVIAVGLAFGLHLTPENQSVIMTFAAAVVAMFTRQVVTAPVTAIPRKLRSADTV